MSQQRNEGQPPERFDKIQYADLSPESTWIRLGKGSFGCVYKGEYLGIEVAIKEVLPSTEYDVEKYLQREITLMQQARHPNIVQYLALSLAPPSADSTIPDRPRILIISEFLPRGNLRQYILDRTLPLPWRLRISFAVDIARALAYLHSNNCMHRDLKGENLLVTSNERLKACDFGLARVAPGGGKEDEAWRRLTYCGTDGYMSPEILLGEAFDLKTDIFSLGVLFVEIASRQLASNHTFVRQLPDYGMSHDEVWGSVSSNCPRSFVELALECCDVNPAKRPDTKAILRRLRDVEQEVLDLDARGLGDEDAHTRGRLATTKRRGSVAANVGSISYAGTTKRESGKGYGAVGGGRGTTRPSAPRLPSFEGQVNLQLGSSFVGGAPPTTGAASGRSFSASIPSSIEFGHARAHEESTYSDDEDSEVLLALADADVPIDSLDMRPDSAYMAAARGRADHNEADASDEEYSTSVVKPSKLLGGGGAAGSRFGAYGRLASSSGSTLPGGGGVDDAPGSLPSLPPSWIAATRRAAKGEDDDESTATVIAPTPQQGSPPRSEGSGGSGGNAQGAESFLTARTSTLSIANAVVGHSDEDKEPLVIASAGAKECNVEEDEEDDVFHSTIQGPPTILQEAALDAPHRFSLIKPGLQRFFGSFAPYSPQPQSLAQLQSAAVAQGKRASWDLGGRLEPGPGAQAGAPGTGRCGLCEKKFGIMKAFLSCDDCGFSTHIKCSDLVPANCPSSPLSPPPSSREASKERGGSKLVKKQRGAASGAKGSGPPLAAVNA